MILKLMFSPLCAAPSPTLGPLWVPPVGMEGTLPSPLCWILRCIYGLDTAPHGHCSEGQWAYLHSRAFQLSRTSPS